MCQTRDARLSRFLECSVLPAVMIVTTKLDPSHVSGQQGFRENKVTPSRPVAVFQTCSGHVKA